MNGRMNSIAWRHEWAPAAARFADHTAVVDTDGAITYAALFDHAAGVAAALADMPADAVVATVMPNGRHAVAASYGVAMAGLTEAPINPALSPDEIAHCARLAGATRLLTVSEVADRLDDLAPILDPRTVPPVPIADLAAVHVDADAPGRIMFTSGTTGKPKGIVHTHGGRWIANILQRASLQIAPVEGCNVLLMTPYSHGASLVTQAFLDGGAAVTLLPGIDLPRVTNALEDKTVDQIFASPSVLVRFAEAFAGRTYRHIRAIYTGTAPLTPDVYHAAKAIFGPVVRITYGKTETFNPITVLTPAETDRWYASPAAAASNCVGWPASGVEIALADDDDPDGAAPAGDDRAAPRPILLRAQHMMAAEIGPNGITRRPPDGFHRTGDLGFIDAEGRLHLAGREADVIKTGGYRVTPDEIEAQLRPAMPGGELVVLSLPSAYWGEIITAVAAGAPEGWEAALRPALEAMTKHKRPRLFVDVEAIARNGLGKVVRNRTREAVLARYRVVDGRYPALEPLADTAHVDSMAEPVHSPK
ncbi:class I adenylate-forming enzyme family protein [Acuticoccus sediminis]|uniref:class I adenylate-forming enzyme family protein n=1 Tax=Acuticoccus sediminis TaxID=2184697 RepID=UPI001CFE77D8|nr:class I adenylate-forming enzyme family protein [Acuticoccus sediminis]